MTDRTSTPPAPGLREAAEYAFEELHNLRYWQDANRTHAKHWVECNDELCVERRAALRAESVAAPLGLEENEGLRRHLREGHGCKLVPEDAAALHAPPALDAVAQFADEAHDAMLDRMRDGERRGWGTSWRDDYPDVDVTGRLLRTVDHLQKALGNYRVIGVGEDELRRRAADVANQAFMLADPARLRAATPASGEPAAEERKPWMDRWGEPTVEPWPPAAGAEEEL